jgi:glucokinase
MSTDTRSESSLTVGVDLGGTKILAALVGPDGRVLATVRRDTDVDGGFPTVIQQVVEVVGDCRDRAGAAAVEAVGVGVAGQVAAGTGVVAHAPNLNWDDAPLRSALEHDLDLPVAVLNDVRAAAWGEWLYGAGAGSDDVAVVFVGTGIGGGVVSGGHMLTGCSNTAGELGHITIVAGGRDCHCGNRGCLEAYAGGWAIAERAREAVAMAPNEGAALVARAGAPEDITAATVHEARADGDPLAARLVDETAEHLAAGLVGVVNAFNPCVLVLGGGIIEHAPFYVDRVERHLLARALDAAARDLHVTRAALGDHAGALGAASFARNSQVDPAEGPGSSG